MTLSIEVAYRAYQGRLAFRTASAPFQLPLTIETWPKTNDLCLGKRYLQIIVPEEQAEGILAKDSKSTTARASSDLINSPATSNAPVKQASNQTGDYKLDQPGKSPRSFTTDVNEKLGKVGSNESDAVRPWDPSTLTSNHQNNVTDPNHIKRRSSGATDAREALSSHPTLISTSAPHRPLPIIPSRNFTPGTKKRNDVSPQKGREPPAQPLGSPVKRSSVQVMETAQLTNEEVARTDLLDEKRSLDALRIDISAHPRPLKTTGLKSAQPLLSSGTSTPRREFSRPSSSTGPSGRMSTHEERKERTRALKLRDMPRSRQPSSNNLLVPKPTTSDRSTSTLSTLNKGGLSFSPVTTTASISPWDPSNSPKLENKIIRRADNPTKRRNFQSKAGEQPFERSPRELDSAQVNSTIKRYSNSDSDHLLLRSQNRPLSTNDPKELLEQLEKLDRHNKLLEAALAAVLKTNGRLNACPCGGTGLSQTALDAYRTTRRDL